MSDFIKLIVDKQRIFFYSKKTQQISFRKDALVRLKK